MNGREGFLLRVDPSVLEALRCWARDELRSVNGQIEFILRRALADTGRLPSTPPPGSKPQPSNPGRRGRR